MEDLYKILDIDKTASKEEIRKAYRKEASKYHPDKGGDIEKFHFITLAHNILTDNNKKSYYDKTGQYSTKPNNIEQKALQEIIILFNKQIESLVSGDVDIIYKNIIVDMKHSIRIAIDNAQNKIKESYNKKKKLKALTKRFVYTGKQINVIENIINQQIANLLVQINIAKELKAIGEKMIELFKDYEFYENKKENDNIPFMARRFWGNNFTGFTSVTTATS